MTAVAMAISLFTTAVLLVEALYLSHVRPMLEENRNVESQYLNLYLADLQYLQNVPYLQPMRAARAGRSDAGAFLNEKVYWSPPLDPALKIKPSGATRPLTGPGTRESILRLQGEWLKKHTRVTHLKGDLSIFTALDRFDYWDIETNSPISTLAEKGIYVPPSKLPFPDIQDLLSLAKIRLMKAAMAGPDDFVAALSDVRNLARLALTTENQQLILTGLTLLDTERFAYDYFVKDRQMPASSWVPIEVEPNKIAHRAILATRSFLHLWTKTEYLEQIFHAEPPPIGFCSALNEALPLEFALRRVLEPQLPFEIRLRSEFASLDSIYRRGHSLCRLRYLSEMVARDAFAMKVPGPFILNRLPWARKVFALRLSASAFRGFSEYSTPTKTNMD